MPLIPVKTAVEASILYFQEVLSPTDIRLEEIELSDDERYWLVTLSALLPLKSDGFALPDLRTLRTAFGRTLERVYKQFKIDAETGEVRSMKIRQVEPISG